MFLFALFFSAHAATPATVTAAKAKVMKHGLSTPPIVVNASESRGPISMSVSLNMVAWVAQGVRCPIMPSPTVEISYLVATDGSLPMLSVSVDVVIDAANGQKTTVVVTDMFLDGKIDGFLTLDGQDLSSQLTIGQTIYDQALNCYTGTSL